MSAPKAISMLKDDYNTEFFSVSLDNLFIAENDEEPMQLCVQPQSTPPVYDFSNLQLLKQLEVAISSAENDAPKDFQYDTLDESFLLSSLSEAAIYTTTTPANTPASTPASTPAVTPLHTPGGPTPAHTPGPTPGVSPCSSYPSSPRGSSFFSQSSKYDGQQSKATKIPRHKRKSHIDAEHRRRNKIQTAFEKLLSTVPTLSDTPAVCTSSTKDTKAVMLNKTVDFCRQLRSENKELQREAAQLREEIEALTADINTYQEQLPATGIAVSQQNLAQPAERLFEEYVQTRTRDNWKFWMFGVLIRPLFHSYNETVNTDGPDTFYTTVIQWMESNLSLPNLRQAALNAMRYISRTTSVVSTPDLLPQEALRASIESYQPSSDVKS